MIYFVYQPKLLSLWIFHLVDNFQKATCQVKTLSSKQAILILGVKFQKNVWIRFEIICSPHSAWWFLNISLDKTLPVNFPLRKRDFPVNLRAKRFGLGHTTLGSISNILLKFHSKIISKCFFNWFRITTTFLFR